MYTDIQSSIEIYSYKPLHIKVIIPISFKKEIEIVTYICRDLEEYIHILNWI